MTCIVKNIFLSSLQNGNADEDRDRVQGREEIIGNTFGGHASSLRVPIRRKEQDERSDVHAGISKEHVRIWVKTS